MHSAENSSSSHQPQMNILKESHKFLLNNNTFVYFVITLTFLIESLEKISINLTKVSKFVSKFEPEREVFSFPYLVERIQKASKPYCAGYTVSCKSSKTPGPTTCFAGFISTWKKLTVFNLMLFNILEKNSTK